MNSRALPPGLFVFSFDTVVRLLGQFLCSASSNCTDSSPFGTGSTFDFFKRYRFFSYWDNFNARLPQTVSVLLLSGQVQHSASSKCPDSSLIGTFSTLDFLKLSRFFSFRDRFNIQLPQNVPILFLSGQVQRSASSKCTDSYLIETISTLDFLKLYRFFSFRDIFNAHLPLIVPILLFGSAKKK